MTERPLEIEKLLSRNDAGETGAHQAGIHVPKDPSILTFFPSLDCSTKNPRHTIFFRDEAGAKWEFNFIYYNNKFFGGTRNEYRLTCMTPFFKAHKLEAGDSIKLLRDDDEATYHIEYTRRDEPDLNASNRLKLSLKWVVVKIKK